MAATPGASSISSAASRLISETIAVVAAGQLDLGHHAVPLDGDDDAGQPVAGARRTVAARQRREEAGQLAGRQDALVAAALEGDPALRLPAAQGVDADAHALGHLTDAQVVDHGVSVVATPGQGLPNPALGGPAGRSSR